MATVRIPAKLSKKPKFVLLTCSLPFLETEGSRVLEKKRMKHRCQNLCSATLKRFEILQKKKNIGTQGVQELFFFVNRKPLEVVKGAYQSIVKP